MWYLYLGQLALVLIYRWSSYLRELVLNTWLCEDFSLAHYFIYVWVITSPTCDLFIYEQVLNTCIFVWYMSNYPLIPVYRVHLHLSSTICVYAPLLLFSLQFACIIWYLKHLWCNLHRNLCMFLLCSSTCLCLIHWYTYVNIIHVYLIQPYI